MFVLIDFLLVLAAVLLGLFIYRFLVHSRLFGVVVDDIVTVPPQTADDVLDHAENAMYLAGQTAATLDSEAQQAKAKAAKLDKFRQVYGG